MEYSGNKLATQHLVFSDGSMQEISVDTAIQLSAAEQKCVADIRAVFKDGKEKTISYDAYHSKTVERQDIIRYSDIAGIQDDSVAFRTDMGPHETKDLDFFRYLPYIEGREGVVKKDGHGLFGLPGNIPIEEAKDLATEHQKSRKWSHIISMDKDDAIATGFDHREAWKDLIVSKAPEIAEEYAISPENLVINCAYHANTDNPHIHLMFYSKDSTEGFVKGGKEGMNNATEKLKSTLVNTIFKDETVTLGKEKSTQRDRLRQQLQERLETLAQSPVSKFVEPLEELSAKLEDAEGKRVYEFLPPQLKLQVDAYVEEVIHGIEDLSAIFEAYCGVQEKMIARYVSSPEKLQAKMEQFRSGFFHPGKKDLKLYHNMVIRAALELCETRAAWQRTTEEKITDNTMPKASLSSSIWQSDNLLSPEQQKEITTFLEGGETGLTQDNMRPHYTIIQQARNLDKLHYQMQGAEYNAIHNSIGWYAKLLDENLYNAILRENKACFKEINETVVKGLWNHLENGEMLTLLQALREIPCENLAARQEAVKAIRQYIYRQDSPVDEETAFTEDMERCVTALREPFERFADTNTALGFQERLRTDLWQSDLSCSNSFIITHFAEELDEHRCEVFLKRQLKSPEVRRFRTHLYQALQQVYQSEPLKKEQLFWRSFAESLMPTVSPRLTVRPWTMLCA